MSSQVVGETDELPGLQPGQRTVLPVHRHAADTTVAAEPDDDDAFAGSVGKLPPKLADDVS